PATRGAAGEVAPGVWRRSGWPLTGSPRPSPAAGTKGPAKEAWVDSVSMRRSGTLPALCPRCQPGDSSLPCWNQTVDGGPRWVMYVAPGNRLKSGGKKGVGLRKPPEVKEDFG
ncbi:unnamed protein product, partial [Gulo gulo]